MARIGTASFGGAQGGCRTKQNNPRNNKGLHDIFGPLGRTPTEPIDAR